MVDAHQHLVSNRLEKIRLVGFPRMRPVEANDQLACRGLRLGVRQLDSQSCFQTHVLERRRRGGFEKQSPQRIRHRLLNQPDEPDNICTCRGFHA